MQHIGSEKNIGLFARGVMFDTYRDKCDFTFVSEKVCYCYEGKVDSSKLIQAIDGISVVAITDDNIEKVIEYDRQVYNGFDRSPLIQEICKIEEYVNGVALNHNNQVLGFCLLNVSVFNTGMVEPLYANDEKIAELLLSKCCQSLAITETNGLIYPCFNTNIKSVAIAEKLGLKRIRELPTLFTKQIVEGDMDRTYCLSSRAFYPF